MGWKIFQVAVVVAVIGANIQWKIGGPDSHGPGGNLAAALVGIVLAAVLTGILYWTMEAWRRSQWKVTHVLITAAFAVMPLFLSRHPETTTPADWAILCGAFALIGLFLAFPIIAVISRLTSSVGHGVVGQKQVSDAGLNARPLSGDILNPPNAIGTGKKHFG